MVVIKEKGNYKVESTINAKGTIFRAEVRSGDPYDCVDRCIEKLSSQMCRFKTKLQKKHKGQKSVDFADVPAYRGAGGRDPRCQEKEVRAVTDDGG